MRSARPRIAIASGVFELDPQIPTDADALRDAIEASIRRVVTDTPDGPVVQLDASRLLHIGLTGATVTVDDQDLGKRPPKLTGTRTRGPQFDTMTVMAAPVHLDLPGSGTLPAELAVEGQDVGFDFVETDRQTLAMVPSSGRVELTASADKRQILSLLEAKTKTEAARQKVDITSLSADVSSPGPREVRVTGRVTGSKKVAFFNANFAVEFEAEAVIEPGDDGTGLIARVTTLDLSGDGTVMSMILSVAKPKIDAIKATPISLEALLQAAGVSGLGVTDVAVSADDRLAMRVVLQGAV